MTFKDQIDKLQKLFTDAFILWDVDVKMKNMNEEEYSCAVFFNVWGNDILLELEYEPYFKAWRLTDDDAVFTVSSYEEVWMIVATQMQSVISAQERKISRLEHIVKNLTKV